MLDLRKELVKAIELGRISLDKEQDKRKELRMQFDIGSIHVNINTCSENQLLYLMGLLNSRLQGAKLLRGRSELINKCQKDINDAVIAVAHVEECKFLIEEVNVNEALLRELNSLLTDEEKRTLFKEKLT